MMGKSFFRLKSRVLLATFFLIGLLYVALPGPSSIKDFSPLPDSAKSDLDGDTWQNPNLVAYFSQYDRNFITRFYKGVFQDLYIWGILPPISLNHAPEMAYNYLRDQQESTFLEEYTYPLRESFFVNGYEPFVENEIFGREHFPLRDRIIYNDKKGVEGLYASKTTIRFYPTKSLYRSLIYIGIWFGGFGIYYIGRKAWRL